MDNSAQLIFVARAAEDSAISRDLAKKQARVLSADENALFDLWCPAVTRIAEALLQKTLVSTQWRLLLDEFPCSSDFKRWAEIRLPMPPVASIESITYINTAGTSTPLVVTTDYDKYIDGDQPIITPAYSKSWPSTRAVPRAVTVNFTAGYANINDIPANIKQILLEIVTSWYENRGALTDQGVLLGDWVGMKLQDAGFSIDRSYAATVLSES
jgi:uncharacterized phiE125 gp8 family phage protein